MSDAGEPLNDAADIRWKAFTVLFAAAASFHVLGNAVFAEPSGVVLVAVGAAAVVLLPGRRSSFALLTAGVLLLVWQEAPLLSNHWALAGFVALGATIGSIGSRARPLAVVRACYLAFYAFAAFAKLNGDFFDPAVSCAGEYLGATADAVGLGGAELLERSWVLRGAAYGTAAVELLIPVLLLRRRTRTVGVIVAVAFHLVVALPRDHQFFDFSSMLLAGGSTFLPPAFHHGVVNAFRRVDRRLLQAAGVVLVAVVGVLGAADIQRDTLIDLGWWAWQPFSVAALVAVVLFARRSLVGADVGLWPKAAWAAVVPVVVVLNGLTPYAELKTQASWNMYANLRTAGGDSNHLLVRRTFPITSPQDDLVEVVDTDDGGLAVYRDHGFLLPVRTVRAYLEARGDVDATLDLGGDRVEVRGGEPLPSRLGPPVPGWVERWFLLRAVDGGPAERCQTGFLPAR